MTAPDFTPEQLATLERIEAAPAAPESFIGSDGLANDQRRALSPRIGNGWRDDLTEIELELRAMHRAQEADQA